MKGYIDDDFEKRYKLGTQIGKGAFSIVKNCVEQSTGKRMAAKIFNTEKLSARDFSKIEREVRICKKLKHKNIVELYEAITNKNYFYIIMELVDGGELFDDIVARDFYSEIDTSLCMKQLFSGVAYFHSCNIVHRDLKPENLLLSSRQPGAVLKIADFGLAVESADSPAWHGLAGTPGYLSPEVISKMPYSYPVDNWACGVIMYILMVGYPPFWDDTTKGLFKQIKSGVVNFPSPEWDSASEDAKYIIKNLLSVNPTYRFTAADVLKLPWITNTEKIVSPLHRQETINHLKQYNARRKMKVAILSTIFAARGLKLSGKISNVKSFPKNDDIIDLTDKLIQAINSFDSLTFQKLVSREATMFGSNTGGVLIGAYNYYQAQFKLKLGVKTNHDSTVLMESPHIQMLSQDSAYVTFVCIVQYVNINQEVVCDKLEETVIWKRLEGHWTVTHLHISHSSDDSKYMDGRNRG